MLLAVLGGYDLKPFAPGLFSAVLAATGAFIYIASVYGDAFGLEFAKKTSLKARDYTDLMANPGTISALLPWLLVAILIWMSALNVSSVQSASDISQILLIVLLFVLGYLAGRRTLATTYKCARKGLLVAAFGWVLADMRLLIELVKQG